MIFDDTPYRYVLLLDWLIKYRDGDTKYRSIPRWAISVLIGRKINAVIRENAWALRVQLSVLLVQWLLWVIRGIPRALDLRFTHGGSAQAPHVRGKLEKNLYCIN